MTSRNGDSVRHIDGFDNLRAFFSICVVTVHSGYIAPSDLFDKLRFESHVICWSDIVDFDVLLLAVPVFALISCYLFAMKQPGDERLGQRLLRTSRLLVFWMLLSFLSEKGLNASIQKLGLGILEAPFWFIISAGDTIFYFFSALIVLLPLTSFAKRLKLRASWGLFALSLAIVGFLPLIAVWLHVPALVHHANPLNFLPLAFAAVVMQAPPFKRNGQAAVWPGLAALAAGGLATALDWTVYRNGIVFEVNAFAVPAYTRPSVVLLAVAVVHLATLIRRPCGSVVRFMSRHSLALYCIHPFVLTVVYRILPRLQLAGPPRLVVCATTTVIASYALALILPSFLRKDLLS